MTSTRNRLLATTMICGVAFGAPAFAQQTQSGPGGTGTAASDVARTANTATGAAADGNDLIVVTGSRIAQPQLTSATPLTVVGNEALKLTGTTNVEDILNSLPQVFAGQGGNLSNGATGTASVDLRGLQPKRTLVLVNNRRLVPGDPTFPVADLNFIPAALVQRVEVLTGGASSVYGADAVAGVVNFVLDTNFEGLKLDGQYSFYQHNNDGDQRVKTAIDARGFQRPQGNTIDGQGYTVNAAIGLKSPDGRGHVSVYAGYRTNEAITQAERDFSACSLGLSGTGFACAGSSTSVPGRFITNGGAAGAQSLTLDPATGNTSFRPYVGSRDAFNFAPYNYFQRPDERFTLGGFAEYEVTSYFKPYLEAMFLDDHTNAVIAPSGIFLQQQQINCDNPLLSAAQVASICTRFGFSGTQSAPVLIGRRNVEGGGRDSNLTHTDFRIVIGTKGDLGGGFSYDFYGQYGKARRTQIYFQDFSTRRTQNALQVVRTPNADGTANPNGAPVCKSFLDGTDPACVPYNVFRGVGLVADPSLGVTQAALNYLETPGFQVGEATEQVVSGSITGSDLGQYGLKSPFAESGIGISVGGEYRSEDTRTDTDAEFATGDLAGQGAATLPTRGSYNLAEGFAELSIPLIEKKPFAELLRLEAGYRYSSYNRSGTTDTYKVIGTYKPIRDISLRGGYNRAVRAPNTVELFAPQTVNLFNGNDPCAGPAVGGLVNGNSFAQCARTGVTAAQFGNILDSPANQYNQFTGGNPNLRPEKSDSYSAGIVLTPRFLPRFSLTVDYYDIKVKGAISSVGANLSLGQCVQNGTPALCSNVHRDPVTGSIFLNANGFVTDFLQNIGTLENSGIDIESAYKFSFSDVGLPIPGGLSFTFFGTLLDKVNVTPGVLGSDGRTTTYNCKGYYGIQCGATSLAAVNPEWRHTLRATYTSPGGFEASVRWRYFAAVRVDASSTNDFLLNGGGVVAAADRRLSPQHYIDLAFQAKVSDRNSIRVGVNNVLDYDPPIVSSSNLSAVSGNGNTYPNVYDAQGRYFFAGFTANF